MSKEARVHIEARAYPSGPKPLRELPTPVNSSASRPSSPTSCSGCWLGGQDDLDHDEHHGGGEPAHKHSSFRPTQRIANTLRNARECLLLKLTEGGVAEASLEQLDTEIG